MYIYHNRNKNEYKTFRNIQKIAEYSGMSYHTLQSFFSRVSKGGVRNMQYDKKGITITKE